MDKTNTILLCIGCLLVGIIIGGLYNIHLSNVCEQRFKLCKDAYNNECINRMRFWEHEDFKINISTLETQTK